MEPQQPPPRGIDLFELIGPPSDETARKLVYLLYLKPRPQGAAPVAKPRLTADQHAELGRALAGIHDELVHRKVQLGSAYPKTGPEAEPAREIEKALGALRKARTALENAAFREHPDTATTQLYYPHPEDRASVTGPAT
ncbi:hypothetical protein BX265_2335 [Streptomyces sp. TLI_235]|nr:hypothetical protein [Streptomyces sp. TLI_235]PBC77584.1 hypothetical protein BX265_2335 [Streptomyces sp. TLI_235]